MDSDLAQEAISAALCCDWKKAIFVNSKIIEIDPNNLDALNRIARAYAENGNIKKAKKTTKIALGIDPLNPIAKRCWEKWDMLSKKTDIKNNGNSHKFSTNAFIENDNHTKVVELINIGEVAHLARLIPGEVLQLSCHSHRINVTDSDEKYIGRFPDNLAARFISLIKLGEKYEVVIVSVNNQGVKVLVKHG